MSSTPTFQRETLAGLWDELLPLLSEHWREVAHYQDIPLDPNRERYLEIEDVGMIRAFTARSADWQLLGYVVYIVAPNLHYRGSLQANQDVIFVRPEHRGIGRHLLAYADAELAREGVQAVYQHVKAAHNFGPMLERQGYELVDLIYAKRLDR